MEVLRRSVRRVAALGRRRAEPVSVEVELRQRRRRVAGGRRAGTGTAVTVSPDARRPQVDAGAERRPARRVRAPLVGTFYRAPEPGATPFVEVGDLVEPGQLVGIVEAMKLMNPR